MTCNLSDIHIQVSCFLYLKIVLHLQSVIVDEYPHLQTETG